MSGETSKRALVIGGGLAGIEAAIKIGEAGHEVLLIERQPVLGGTARRLYRSFPRWEDPRELLDAKLEQLAGLEDVKVLLSTEVVASARSRQGFLVRLRFTGEGEEPIDSAVKASAIVLATGFELFDAKRYGEYGYGTYPGVVTALGDVIEERQVRYVRGRPSKVLPSNGRLLVRAEDTLMGVPVEVEADLVVLATAAEPSTDAVDLARLFYARVNENGFLEPDVGSAVKCGPRVFLAGASGFAVNMTEVLQQGAAAAAEVIGLFRTGAGVTELEPGGASGAPRLDHEPDIALRPVAARRVPPPSDEAPGQAVPDTDGPAEARTDAPTSLEATSAAAPAAEPGPGAAPGSADPAPPGGPASPEPKPDMPEPAAPAGDA